MSKEESEEGDFIFSKELREGLEDFQDFKDKTPDECLSDPSFFNALLKLTGASKEEQKKMWSEVGRPDCFDDKEN